jgi:hypothetical protein
MKQLIEDLISAIEYHVEQTRPIHSTTVALNAAREALKTMSTPLACDCNQGQVCHVCDPIIPPEAQRQWVGLTDEEIEQEFGFIDELLRDCVQRTEAMLRVKNQ